MAFGQSRTSNYVRVQATGIIAKNPARMDHSNNKNNTNTDILALTEEMLAQRNVESILFEGKKMVESTNLKKLELFAGEVIKEEERRKTSILPTVALKQTSGSPARTSSATTLSSLSSSCWLISLWFIKTEFVCNSQPLAVVIKEIRHPSLSCKSAFELCILMIEWCGSGV